MTYETGILAGGQFWQAWLPAGAPRGVVLIAHGLAEHSGRYGHVAAHLNAHDFAVYAVDHLGHGRSPGKRCQVESFADYSAGMDALFAQASAAHPATPISVLGHSMGGLIAGLQLIEHPGRYHAAILSGPAVQPVEPPPGWQEWLVRKLARFAPGVGVIALDSNAISRDGDVVTAYHADPLVYNGKISARLAAELFDAMQRLRERAGEIKTPLLVMHGSDDRLTAPAGSTLLVERAGATDKTLKTFNGLYHEIFNEPEQAMILDLVSDWLGERHPG